MNKIKLLIGLILYKIAPIKKQRYVFTSFNGHYSDNPKPISNKLHEMNKNAEIIWLVSPKYLKDVPSYAKAVDIDSLKAFWYRGTATAGIDNVYGFRASFIMSNSFLHKLKTKIFTFLSYKKHQPIYSTMHGTPLKRLGRDQVGNTVLDMYCKNSYLLVGDEFSAKILSNVTFNKMPVKVTGSPRNDILFKASDGLKEKLNLPSDKKVILFAPTFRNDGKDVEGKNLCRSGLDQLNAMNLDLLFDTLKQKFGGDWVMVLRFHYHVAHMVDWESLNKNYPGKFINGNEFDDMAEYLACTDVLLTDSSSSMFDFAHTGKPCFLFFPDYVNYRDKERGFYMDASKLPFKLSEDFDTLIKHLKNFDNDTYIKEVNALKKCLGDGNDGNSSERIVNIILNN